MDIYIYIDGHMKFQPIEIVRFFFIPGPVGPGTNLPLFMYIICIMVKTINSPVDFRSNPEISCPIQQYKPLDRKFSALYDGISCQFVGVEQFSQFKKL